MSGVFRYPVFENQTKNMAGDIAGIGGDSGARAQMIGEDARILIGNTDLQPWDGLGEWRDVETHGEVEQGIGLAAGGIYGQDRLAQAESLQRDIRAGKSRTNADKGRDRMAAQSNLALS